MRSHVRFSPGWRLLLALALPVLRRTNLNFATLEELEVVPGFTAAFAQEVIDYRTNFGGFQNTRELVDILGMSEADFVVARRYLTL